MELPFEWRRWCRTAVLPRRLGVLEVTKAGVLKLKEKHPGLS